MIVVSNVLLAITIVFDNVDDRYYSGSTLHISIVTLPVYHSIIVGVNAQSRVKRARYVQQLTRHIREPQCW